MPARRASRKRGSTVPRGRGRARKSARLAVVISKSNDKEDEETKSVSPPKSDCRVTRSTGTEINITEKKGKEVQKNAADDFEDITSGNEFEAIDSDPDLELLSGDKDSGGLLAPKSGSKHSSSVLEDISDCSITDEPELEDISSAGSEHEGDYDLSTSTCKIKKSAVPHTILSDKKRESDELQDVSDDEVTFITECEKSALSEIDKQPEEETNEDVENQNDLCISKDDVNEKEKPEEVIKDNFCETKIDSVHTNEGTDAEDESDDGGEIDNEHVEDETEDQVEDETEGQVEDENEGQVEDENEDQVEDENEDQVEDENEDQVEVEDEDQVEDENEDQGGPEGKYMGKNDGSVVKTENKNSEEKLEIEDTDEGENLELEDDEENLEAEGVEQNKKAEGVEQNKESEDVEHNKESEDVEHNKESEDVEHNKESEDVEHNKESEDVEHNKESEDVEHIKESEDVEPNVESEDVEPNVESEDVEPNVESEDVEPNVESEDVEANVETEDVEPNVKAEYVEHNVESEDENENNDKQTKNNSANDSNQEDNDEDQDDAVITQKDEDSNQQGESDDEKVCEMNLEDVDDLEIEPEEVESDNEDNDIKLEKANSEEINSESNVDNTKLKSQSKPIEGFKQAETDKPICNKEITQSTSNVSEDLTCTISKNSEKQDVIGSDEKIKPTEVSSVTNVVGTDNITIEAATLESNTKTHSKVQSNENKNIEVVPIKSECKSSVITSNKSIGLKDSPKLKIKPMLPARPTRTIVKKAQSDVIKNKIEIKSEPQDNLIEAASLKSLTSSSIKIEPISAVKIIGKAEAKSNKNVTSVKKLVKVELEERKPIMIKKEDLEFAKKNNVSLKNFEIKIERLKPKKINSGNTSKVVDELKELEPIDLSDGWKIMDEAVGDLASENKDDGKKVAKKPVFKKPFIRGLQRMKPAALQIIKDIPSPLVGLDHMVEVWREDGRTAPRYYCAACKIITNMEELKGHMTSAEHKLEMMRVASLDCWHCFPSSAIATWPQAYSKALEELCCHLAQKCSRKDIILVTSNHWYNDRRREIDERVRRMNHPVLSSKVYVPIMEKLPKVETLGEVRKRRSTTDKSQKEGSVATPKDLSDKKSLGETKKPCPHKIEITRNKAAAKKDDSAKSENNSAKTLTSKKVTDKNESSGKTANDTNRPSSAKKEPNKNSSDVKKKPESSESVLSTTSEVKTISKDKRPSIAGPSSKSTGGVKSDKPRQISPLRKRSPNRRTSISPKRMRKTRSPRKRSNSPRKHSPSHLRRSPRRSPLRRSPVSGRFARSPLRITYKRSPVRSPHRSPIRKSPRRSPARRSPFRRSPLRRSPLRRSPLSRRAISPRRRSPLLRRSISPRRRSPIRRQGSPRRRSRSPLSRRLASPRRSPLRRSPIRSSSPRRRSPLMKSYCSNRSPPRRSISPRYQSRSPRNRRDRTPDRDFFQGQSPLPFKREGNVVVVDEDAIQNSSNPQISQTHAQSEEFLSRFNFSSNSSNPIQTNKPGSFPDTTTGNIYQRGGIFATSAKRKTTSFESDLLKRGRVESYSGDPMKVARPVKKNENFWESWHKSHDEEQAEIEQPMQEDIWTKQQSNWTETSTDARGVGLNRQILGRDSISVTVFNKENPNILINKHDGSYRGSNPVNPTAEEIWHQQVELASASRQSVLPQMSRNAGMEWMQNKEKQSFQQSLISDLLSKKEQYHNLGGPSLAPGSQSLGNLGYARMNPRSTGGLDSSESLTIGNWNNMAGGSFLGHMNSIPLNTVSSLTDSWQNPDRSVLPSAAANPVQSSSRFGIVKTGTSSSVHPLAAIGFAGGGLEITGGNSSSIGTGGIISSMRGESSVKSQDKNQRWNALSARSIPGSSNVIGNQQGRNFGAGSIRMPGKQDGNNDSKVVGQDSWRSNIGPGMGHLQQPWRAQQQVEAVPQAPQEDLNAVAQKLNSTLTRILNNYKPTGGLFSNPSLKHGIGGLQQRPDQEMFRPGPIGDKLSLAQNIASALTSMGMANVPQHDLVAILQYLGLLGGGGQGMMPSGNRVMDDLRETVSRFERTFQYHRF